jgi:hypothetical protein
MDSSQEAALARFAEEYPRDFHQKASGEYQEYYYPQWLPHYFRVFYETAAPLRNSLGEAQVVLLDFLGKIYADLSRAKAEGRGLDETLFHRFVPEVEGAMNNIIDTAQGKTGEILRSLRKGKLVELANIMRQNKLGAYNALYTYLHGLDMHHQSPPVSPRRTSGSRYAEPREGCRESYY